MAESRSPAHDLRGTRSLRIPPELIAGARRVADANDRSVSAQIRRYVREGLARDGVTVDCPDV